MIIVGFLLFAAAVVLTVALTVRNPATVTVHLFNQYRNVEMRWLFVAGLALTATGLLGLAMMRLVVAPSRRSVGASDREQTARPTCGPGAPMGPRAPHSAAARAGPRRGTRPASDRRSFR